MILQLNPEHTVQPRASSRDFNFKDSESLDAVLALNRLGGTDGRIRGEWQIAIGGPALEGKGEEFRVYVGTVISSTLKMFSPGLEISRIIIFSSIRRDDSRSLNEYVYLQHVSAWQRDLDRRWACTCFIFLRMFLCQTSLSTSQNLLELIRAETELQEFAKSFMDHVLVSPASIWMGCSLQSKWQVCLILAQTQNIKSLTN